MELQGKCLIKNTIYNRTSKVLTSLRSNECELGAERSSTHRRDSCYDTDVGGVGS